MADDTYFTEREIEKINIKYPEKVPIIFNCASLKKPIKIVALSTLTIIKFAQYIKHNIGIKEYEAMLFFIGDKLIGTSGTLGMLYQMYKHKNGVLYIFSIAESAFG